MNIVTIFALIALGIVVLAVGAVLYFLVSLRPRDMPSPYETLADRDKPKDKTLNAA